MWGFLPGPPPDEQPTWFARLRHWPPPELPPSAMRSGIRRRLVAVRAAARRAHGQSGYLGECIQGERTALRQAVHSNGTPLSSTVSLAVMRRFRGIVSTFLTLNWAAAPAGKVQDLRGPVPQQRSAAPARTTRGVIAL